MGLGFNFKEMKDKLNKDEKKFGGSNDGEFAQYEKFIPKKGSNVLRIVSRGEEVLPYVSVGFHYKVFGSTFLCRKVVANEHCPLCDLVSDLKETGNETDEKTANRIRSSLKAAWLVIDREEEKLLKDSDELPKVRIWYAAKRATQQLITFLQNPEKYGDILNIQGGHDIEVLRVEKGNYTNYEVNVLAPESNLLGYGKFKKVNLKKLLKGRAPLDFVPLSEEELKKVADKFYSKMDSGEGVENSYMDKPNPLLKEKDEDRELEESFVEENKMKTSGKKSVKNLKKEDEEEEIENLDEDELDDVDDEIKGIVED